MSVDAAYIKFEQAAHFDGLQKLLILVGTCIHDLMVIQPDPEALVQKDSLPFAFTVFETLQLAGA